MHAYFSMSSTLRHCAAASGHLVQPAALPRMHHCFSGSTRKATGHFSISAQSCAPCLPPVSAERISNSQQSAALATSRRSAVVTAAKEGKAEPSVPAVDKARANGSPSNGEDGESCIIADIRTENDEHPELSVLSMEVPDFPGQFRVTAWVLNGLGLDVQNAELAVTDDGIARDKFWLTDAQGRKLSDRRLQAVADRLEDFVEYCAPDEEVIAKATRFCHGPITVDNEADPERSVITIFAPSQRGQRLPRSLLLEIASCINGVGVRISRAVIQGCSDCGVPISEDEDFRKAEQNGARLYKVWGTDRAGRKLDQQRAIALIYTMSLLFGDASTTGSTTVPRYDFY